MPSLNFPDSPSLNEIHSENGTSWKWNGYGWISMGVAVNNTSGGIAYGIGSGYLFSAAGNSGEILMSSGPNAPIWTTIPSDTTATFLSFW
jgi:hypothetical protein